MTEIEPTKSFCLRDIPEESRVEDWSQADPFAHTMAIRGKIKDYSPLAQFPNLRRLHVSQANPLQLQVIGTLTRLHCLNIAWLRSTKDLSPLANLTNLQHLNLYGNIPGVSLEPLKGLTNLRRMEIWSLVSNTSALYLDTFQPLGALVGLEWLDIYGYRTRDDSLAPLAKLTNLRKLGVSNWFPIAEFARLAVALPNTDGGFHSPVVHKPVQGALGLMCKKCGAEEKVMLVGKSRPAFACPVCESKHIERHIAEFERCKHQFESQAQELP